MKKFITSIILSTFSLISYSQQGVLEGNVIDTGTHETLVGASVFIKGSTIGTITDFQGHFKLTKVPVGVYTLVCSFISYDKCIRKDIRVVDGTNKNIDFSMYESNIKLNDIRVTAKLKRESELSLLLDRQKSIVMQESIGSQELSLQGISDASAAATKITGISIDASSNSLNVRGLGDRYNNTTLNGLPLPSNNAEYKNISLDLFTTDIIEYINIDKSSNPYLSGEYAGANINIESKQHSGKSYIKVGIKSSYNSNMHKADGFYLGSDYNKMGFKRFRYPDITESKWKYNFANTWNPKQISKRPNMGFKLISGKTFNIGNSKLNTFTSLQYSNKYSYSDILKRKVNGSDYIRSDLRGEMYKYTSESTGIINLNLKKYHSKYYYNLLFMNSSDQQLQNLRGEIIDLADEGAYVRRMQFERTMLIVNQFLANHELSPRVNIDWALAYNNVSNIAPDRRHNTLENGSSRKKIFATNDAANNNRYFHNLKEREYAGKINLDFKFGTQINSQYKYKLSVGGDIKYKDRDFESTQFNHQIHKNRLVDINNIDSYFNNTNYENGIFDFKVRSDHFISYNTYSGNQDSKSVYSILSYNSGKHLEALIGLRYENIYQSISYNTSLGEGKEYFRANNLLPSISLKYSINKKAHLRLSSGISYTLPQFKETALFQFEGITESTVGNPYLKPSRNYNLELKLDIYPKHKELISISCFGKYIKDPINKFVMASASNDISYANTGNWAKVYGLELEAKKKLFVIKGSKYRHEVFSSANISLMHTEQELDSKKISLETNNTLSASFNKNKEQLQGASPFIANANISYKISWKKKNITSSIIYRRVSDRINNIAYASLGNKIDQTENNLDFVVVSHLNNLGISFSAKNLLNKDINRIQDNANNSFLINSYNKGVTLGLGFTYKY